MPASPKSYKPGTSLSDIVDDQQRRSRSLLNVLMLKRLVWFVFFLAAVSGIGIIFSLLLERALG